MAVSLGELLTDRAVCPVTLNGVTFDVEYAPSKISARLIRDVGTADRLPSVDQFMLFCSVAHQFLTGWELHEDEPAELAPEDRPLIPLTLERLEAFPALVLAAIVQAVFGHMRMGKTSGMTPVSSLSVPSVVNGHPSASSQTGTTPSSRAKNSKRSRGS